MILGLLRKIGIYSRPANFKQENLIQYYPGKDPVKMLSDSTVHVLSGDYDFELPIDENHHFKISIPSGKEELAIIFNADSTRKFIALASIWIKGECHALTQMLHPSEPEFKATIHPISNITGNCIEVYGVSIVVEYAEDMKHWTVTTC
ncbi:MAG: hypothetical protein ACERJ1_08110 [Halodesulfovibrio sp.]|uniref:hypothetical protein n=1 Tax=Halodesulfovibrio sp. TaxID=1912772 RepID=UPI00359DC3D3